eukprot:scaffold20684_cov93-Phaeocystis_antarctica.AAC.1
MFLVGVLALGRVLWWIRTLHIQIWRPRDNFLHAGFLSPPVSDRATEHAVFLRTCQARPIRAHTCPGTLCEVPECGKRPRTGFATCPSAGRQVRLRRARFDSRSYQVDGRLRPRVEGAG